MVPKTGDISSVENPNGEETRIRDIKVEETEETFGTIVVKKEEKEGRQNVSPSSEGTGKKRRGSEENLQKVKVEALMPNSKSMPIIHTGDDKAVDRKLNSAGIASSQHIAKVGEKIEKQLDLTNPHNLLLSYLREDGYKAYMRKSSTLTDFFLELKSEHIEAYSAELVKAVRDRNIPLLRAIHAEGKTLQCSNRFGESLVHMACRRGYTDVVRFLIKEADVTLRVKDDFGRTPLHDACWSANPNFDLMDLIINHDPDLLLIEDIRGHSPFSYARRDHWEDWKNYLTERRASLRLNTFTE